MDTTTEAPAAAPAVEMSLDQIVAAELAAATTDVIKPDPGTEPAKVEGADVTPPAGTEAPATTETPAAEEKPADDVSAARVRKMLAKVEEQTAQLAQREQDFQAAFIAELVKNPKALLARVGKSIDDVIDASINEGKGQPAKAEAAEEDDSPRLTALEKRIEDRERNEADQRTNAAIAAKKAEIAASITASPKFPLVNETKRTDLVLDYMVEYHATHGKAIAWDRAAASIEADLTALGETVAKKQGWTKPAPVTAAPARVDTPTIGGAQSTGASGTEAEPEDPNKLMDYLVARAGLGR